MDNKIIEREQDIHNLFFVLVKILGILEEDEKICGDVYNSEVKEVIDDYKQIYLASESTNYEFMKEIQERLMLEDIEQEESQIFDDEYGDRLSFKNVKDTFFMDYTISILKGEKYEFKD